MIAGLPTLASLEAPHKELPPIPPDEDNEIIIESTHTHTYTHGMHLLLNECTRTVSACVCYSFLSQQTLQVLMSCYFSPSLSLPLPSSPSLSLSLSLPLPLPPSLPLPLSLPLLLLLGTYSVPQLPEGHYSVPRTGAEFVIALYDYDAQGEQVI